MAPIELSQSFQTARDRLMGITRLAMPDLVKVQAYTDTDSPTTPYAEIVVPTLNLTVVASGKQDITINPEVRLYCGGVFDGYDGILQDTIFFDWLPSITQAFIEHSNLCYTGAAERISSLDTQRTGFQRAQAIVTNTDGWLLVFYWQLTFITGFKKAIGV